MLVGGLIILERQDVDGLAAFPEFCFSRRRGDAGSFAFFLLSDVFLSLLGVGDPELDLRLTTEFCAREFFERVPGPDLLALGDPCRFLGGVGDRCRFLGGVGDRVLIRPLCTPRFHLLFSLLVSALETLLSLYRFLRVDQFA